MPNIDFQGALVEGGAGFVAGGAQRMAWEASEMTGLLTTGGIILGGVLLNSFVQNPMLRQVSRAAVISGASVGGWVAAEKFLIEGAQDRRIGHLPAQLAEQERLRALAEGRGERRFSRTSRNGAAVARAMVRLPGDEDVTVL